MKSINTLLFIGAFFISGFKNMFPDKALPASEDFRIGKQKFNVCVRSVREEDCEIDSLFIYQDNIPDPVLAVLHKDIWNDSNSRSVMVGGYDITGSSFVLYHFWAKAGDAPVSPYGARIQVYGIENDSLVLKSSRLYIETMSDYYIDQYKGKENLEHHAGVVFLHRKPENEIESKEQTDYIQWAEKEYNARFVWGKEAERLLEKVRKRLDTDLRQYTQDWHETFKESGFGYKK